jgi:hypothetical protein
MNSSSSTIELLYNQIPSEVCRRSGKVFYSGRAAFEAQASLYVLGLNPGGDPSEHEDETVESHTAAVLHKFEADWSAYRDESWKDAAPGTSGLQPRVLHMCTALDLNPGIIPCSNLVFVRSRRERSMGPEMKSLAEQCWPFHLLVIEQLRPRAIVCFGKTAGRYVCNRLNATTLCAEFIERNNRRWRSHVFASSTGLKVVVVAHPSVADWCAPATDPTSLVLGALK